jgi:hypothetical protein
MIICADDFGMRDDINRAILELTGQRRLSAVSCMVSLARCTPAVLEPLLASQSAVDIGLHLCLTDEGLPLSVAPGASAGPASLPAFGSLLRRALSGRLPEPLIRRSVAGQYGLFLEKCGRRPDFIDGHLHVHQFPGVAKILAEFVLSLPLGQRPYLRNTWLPLRGLREERLPWTKTFFINLFGAQMFRRLRAMGLATNQGFAGIYDFRDWRQYPKLLPRFAACLPQPNGILVVHPGEDEDWRKQEAATLREFPFAPGMPNRFQR